MIWQLQFFDFPPNTPYSILHTEHGDLFYTDYDFIIFNASDSFLPKKSDNKEDNS
jgi:hypothetical protein